MLREQVIGYARTVDAASSEIAREARIEWTPSLRDDLVFVAGLRKFYSICASSFWAIDNATAFMRDQQVSRVRVGRTDYSRGSPLHAGLRAILRDFDLILQQYQIGRIADVSYVELIQRLANER